MTIENILDKCKHLKVDQKRVSLDEYQEWVIFQEEFDQWNEIMSEVLGEPLKLEDEKAIPEAFSLAENFGGIQDKQILFYRKFEKHSVIAMFWPWSDEFQMTLKIASSSE